VPTDRLVSPDWLQQRLGDPKIRIVEVDYHGTSAWDEGHIPGALGWFWKDWLWDPAMRDFPTPEEFARRCVAAGIADDTTVVFYGDPVQFGTYGWWVFTYMGHRDARVLDGGRVRWMKEKRPWTTAKTVVPSATYTPPAGRNDAMRKRLADLLTDLPRVGKDLALIDHRSPEEYRGERVNMPGNPDVGAERAGHIPGARHLYFGDLIVEDTSFRDAATLERLLRATGAGPDKDVVSYCRLSHRATLVYFAMTQLLGWKNVRSYDGSWTEYGSVVGVPIEK